MSTTYNVNVKYHSIKKRFFEVTTSDNKKFIIPYQHIQYISINNGDEGEENNYLFLICESFKMNLTFENNGLVVNAYENIKSNL